MPIQVDRFARTFMFMYYLPCKNLHACMGPYFVWSFQRASAPRVGRLPTQQREVILARPSPVHGDRAQIDISPHLQPALHDTEADTARPGFASKPSAIDGCVLHTKRVHVIMQRRRRPVMDDFFGP
eukprot:3385792-Pleurochrysis_carterae.AAC.1